MSIKSLLWGVSFWFITAIAAMACSEYSLDDCPPKPIPAVIKFKGEQTIPNPITVWVCHPYWDRLDGDPAKGERWWGPTMKFQRTGWEKDLQPILSRCKRFSVRPGTSITTLASCLNGREISTGPMTRPGTYLMGLPRPPKGDPKAGLFTGS